MVTDTGRMRLYLERDARLWISDREFLNTNGATQYAKASGDQRGMRTGLFDEKVAGDALGTDAGCCFRI